MKAWLAALLFGPLTVTCAPGARVEMLTDAGEHVLVECPTDRTQPLDGARTINIYSPSGQRVGYGTISGNDVSIYRPDGRRLGVIGGRR